MQDTGPDEGWEPRDYLRMINLETLQVPVTVTGVGCEVDGIWEHDYHDIVCPDGHKIDAVSGHHLRKIAKI